MKVKTLLKTLGPGLLYAGAAVGVSHLVQSTRAGASYGFELIWVVIAANVIKYPFFEFAPRYASATGKSLVDGIKDFGMTTNGVFLPKYAKQLKAAGLMRVNISLDTMDPKRYTEITRLGKIDDVFAGIDAAKEAGLFPIKINCVIKKSSQEPDAIAVAEYCKANGLEIRYIHEMNLETGDFSVVEGGDGGDCKNCNRLRLTAKGDLMPCLFSDLSYNIRELGTAKAIDESLKNKPKSGTSNHSNRFNNIGG